METTDSDKHWYVVLTRTNSERKVRDYFQLQEVDTFLPVQNRVIEREGKRIERERLLLPRMVFVHISRQEMAAVRSTLNVYDFLRDRSTGAPTCIPDAQMADFRYMLDYSQDQVILTGESIPKGTRVVVAKGDLQGLRGELPAERDYRGGRAVHAGGNDGGGRNLLHQRQRAVLPD